MPITLKLKPNRPSVSAVSPPVDAPSPSTRRGVSFSDRPSYAPVTPASGQAGPSASSASTSTLPATQFQSEPAAQVTERTKRPRSPSPPPHGVHRCLPLPSPSSAKPRRRRRHHLESTSHDADNRDQALGDAICRLLQSTGYSAAQADVLDLLKKWMQDYLENLCEIASDFALSSVRELPQSADLFDAMVYQGQLAGGSQRRAEETEVSDEQSGDVIVSSVKEEVGVSSESDKKGSKQEADEGWDISTFIALKNLRRQSEEDQKSMEESSGAAGPKWAEESAIAMLVEPSLREEFEQDERKADAARELLSNKSRLKEKKARAEIPDHLPELPALHTWRRTDAYPENRLFSQAGKRQEDGVKSETGADGVSLPTGQATSATLSRLEALLLSSRLVQTSLRALISRLDAAQTMVGSSYGFGAPASSHDTASAAGSTPASVSQLNAHAASGTQTAASPVVVKSPTVLTQDRGRSTSVDSPSNPTSATPTAPGGHSRTSSRLSIRLRQQTSGGATGGLAVPTNSAADSTISPRSGPAALPSGDSPLAVGGAVVPSRPPSASSRSSPAASLNTRRGIDRLSLLDTSVAGSTGLASASASNFSPQPTFFPSKSRTSSISMNASIQRRNTLTALNTFAFPGGSLSGSTTLTESPRSGNTPLATPKPTASLSGPNAWMQPLMSPVTPAIGSAVASAGGLAWATFGSGTPTPTTSTRAGGVSQWPFLQGQGGSDQAEGVGLSMPPTPASASMGPGGVTIPQGVNFKTSWYARKV